MFHKVLTSLPRFNAFSGVPLVLGALGKGEEFGDKRLLGFLYYTSNAGFACSFPTVT